MNYFFMTETYFCMCPINVWTLCNIELNHQDERMVSGSIIGGTTTSSWLQGRAHAWGTEVSGGGGEVGLGASQWEENDVSETPRNPKPPWKHSVPY